MDLLAQMNCGQGLLTLLLIIICVVLMGVILIQRGRGGGLAGAFGGGGGGGAFGAKTGDVFTWVTVVMAGIFVLSAVTANYVLDQSPKPLAIAPATATSAVPLPPESTELPASQPGAVPPIELPLQEVPTGTGGAPGGTTGQDTPSDADAAAPDDGTFPEEAGAPDKAADETEGGRNETPTNEGGGEPETPDDRAGAGPNDETPPGGEDKEQPGP